MTAGRDPDRLIRAYLEEGLTELPDRSYDAVRSQIDQTHQRVVIGPWRLPSMNNFTRLAIVGAAVLVVALAGVYFLPRLGGIGGPGTSPSPVPSPTAVPASSAPPRAFPDLGPLPAGAYFMDPFGGADSSPCGPVPTRQTPPACPDETADDSIRFTFTVPDGWAVAPFQSVWLANGQSSPPSGAGMIFGRGGWLHSDPCVTNDHVQLDGAPVDVPVGPTVDDFANALAEHPVLDVTAPVDVNLDGYSGKYVDLQVPADISACATSYFPWEGGRSLYAQGPSHRWHLWILDVGGVRVVIQTGDYAATPLQRQNELQSIVESIQIEP